MITLNQSIERAQLCYTDTGSFIINIITEDFFVDISDDVERWFDASNYDDEMIKDLFQ